MERTACSYSETTCKVKDTSSSLEKGHLSFCPNYKTTKQELHKTTFENEHNYLFSGRIMWSQGLNEQYINSLLLKSTVYMYM